MMLGYLAIWSDCSIGEISYIKIIYINFEKEDFFNKKTKDNKTSYISLIRYINKILFNYGHAIIYNHKKETQNNKERKSIPEYIIIQNIFLKKITERKIIMSQLMEKKNKDNTYIYDITFFDILKKNDNEILSFEEKIFMEQDDIYEIFGINRPVK